MPHAKREINPLPGILHANDLSGQSKHRKMLKRLKKGKVNESGKWFRKHTKRQTMQQ